MANRRLQCRQLFWRNGWYHGVGARGVRSDWTAPHRPWHNNGDRLGLSDARDGAVVVAGVKDRLAHDQLVGQFHPEDDVGAVEFVAAVDEEGSGEAAADPLARRS